VEESIPQVAECNLSIEAETKIRIGVDNIIKKIVYISQTVFFFKYNMKTCQPDVKWSNHYSRPPLVHPLFFRLARRILRGLKHLVGWLSLSQSTFLEKKVVNLHYCWRFVYIFLVGSLNFIMYLRVEDDEWFWKWIQQANCTALCSGREGGVVLKDICDVNVLWRLEYRIE